MYKRFYKGKVNYLQQLFQDKLKTIDPSLCSRIKRKGTYGYFILKILDENPGLTREELTLLCKKNYKQFYYPSFRGTLYRYQKQNLISKVGKNYYLTNSAATVIFSQYLII